MKRATLFACVGILWCVRSLQSFADPEYQDPVTAADWFAVLSFSAALFALAAALPILAQLVGGLNVFRLSLVPASGAAFAGLANLLEDALQLGFAFWFFIVGTALMGIGLIALIITFAVVGRGRRRLVAIVPTATLVGFALFESGGGILILLAWGAAAAIVLAAQRRGHRCVAR